MPDLAQMMQAFRGLPKLGALSTVGDGLGTARRAPVHVPEGARFEERTFSNDAGSRTYKVYVPQRLYGPVPPGRGHAARLHSEPRRFRRGHADE